MLKDDNISIMLYQAHNFLWTVIKSFVFIVTCTLETYTRQ